MRRDLPSGTVTFLFTDVEGSTKLLHELGAEEYAKALLEHRRILREAFASHGGVEVDTQGDAFFVAFPTASGALAAAEEGRDRLTEGPVRVRMGLHTGTPHLTAEGYIGPDVHEGARIAAAGHGGQVLLSKETRQLVDAEVTDLGEHRVKDFDTPVWIFQLGTERFPPLKSISNTNLPRPASSFVGREREVEEIGSLLSDGARLLTLTGPGGTGKTRLAIEAAAGLVPDFKAGVFWVGLAPLRDPALVTETIAQTLGAKDALAEHIGEREMLLLLDNLEQVVEAAVELAALVEACPNLRLLSTSRERLRVRGEVEYPVPPLAHPEAVELFCARGQVEPDETVRELCRALDNLPLALELAAARTSVLTPKQILERLSKRLDVLKGGRDADPRQQTLRATVEWSYQLLGEEEQRLFARLAVFRGGSTLEAAEEVVDADLDTLQSLVDKSLIRRTDAGPSGETRFAMLQVIREYAGERLAEGGEAGEISRRHAAWVAALVEEAEPELTGESQAAWLARLVTELENVRAALRWLLDAGNAESGLRMAGALWRFWQQRGELREGRAWLEQLLELPGAAVRTAGRAKALTGLAGLLYWQGEHDAVEVLYGEALDIHRELDDRPRIAEGFYNLAFVPLIRGDYATARAHLVEAIEEYQALGDRAGVAVATGDLAYTDFLAGDLDDALPLLERTLALNRELGMTWHLTDTLASIGQVQRLRGETAAAKAAYREALGLWMETRDVGRIPVTLKWLAALALDEGAAVRAVRLGAASAKLGEEIGGELPAALLRVGNPVEEARSRLPASEHARAVAEGAAMSLDEAVAYALTQAPN